MKETLFVFGLLVVVPCATLFASQSRVARDGVFGLIVFGTAFPSVVDINFMSREWYRGSTRGFEVGYLDLLALILLFSCVIARGRESPSWVLATPTGPRIGGRLYWPASLGALLAFFLYCTVNVLTHDPMLFGLFELSKILRGIVLFVAVACYVRGARELEILWAVLSVTMVVVAASALHERYVLGHHRIAGVLGHPNALSTYCCTAGPLLIAGAFSQRRRVLKIACAVAAALAPVCVLLSISRTGIVSVFLVSGATVLAAMGRRITPRKLGALALVAVAGVAMLYKSWDSLSGRFSSTDLEREYLTEDAPGRGAYLRIATKIFLEHPFGVGLNNWSYHVTNEMDPADLVHDYTPYVGTDRRPPNPPGRPMQAVPAHNLAALVLGETGWPGFLLFGLILVTWIRMAVPFALARAPTTANRYGLGVLFGVVGMLLQNLTELTFRSTPVFMLVHVLIGALAAMHHLRRAQLRNQSRRRGGRGYGVASSALEAS